MKKFLVCALVLVICLTAFVACKDKGADLEDLNRAKEFLSTHLNGMKEVTGKDYKLPAVVAIDGVNYTVTWTLTVNTGSDTVVSLGSVENGLQTINIDEFASAEATYTLTATIADENGNTVTVTANRKVPAFSLNTYAEYAAACEASDGETNITVKGYIIGVNADPTSSSTASIWLMDADGHGYYAYKPAKLDGIDYTTREGINAGFPQGKEIVVKGIAKSHNGCYELDSDCEVIFTGNSVDPATLSYVDRTELFSSASSQTDADTLGATAATRATLNGVTMKAPNDYDYFFELNGIEYICRMNIYLMSEEDQNTLMAKWAVGGKANLTGFINVYGGKFQLYPDSLNSVEVINENLTDEQKVARAKENLTLAAKYAENFTLPTSTWADVAWAIEGAGATLGENNAVTINQTNEDQTVTITATITSGEATDTKVFTVVIASSVIDWKDVEFAVTECAKLASGAESEEEYYFYGTVGDIYNTQYCNFYLVDNQGNSIIVYGLTSKDGENRYGSNREIAEIPFQKGDLICLRGNLKKYNTDLEIVSAVEVETPAKGSVAFNAYSVAEGRTECAKLDGSTQEKSEEYFYYVGYVKEIYNTNYCNFYLVDEMDDTDSLTVYGLYAANGTDRYGANREIAQIPFAAGDVVVLKSKLQNYNGTLQLASAILVDYYTVAEKPALETEFTTTNYADIKASVPNANDNSADYYYAIGYVQSIASTIYGNMTIEDAEGNTLYVYGTYGFDGKVRFDKLPVQPKVGDVVVLKGKANNYNGTAQLKNAWIMQIGTEVQVETADYVLAQISVADSASENFTLSDKATWTVKSGTGIAIEGTTATVTQAADVQTVVLTASVTIGGETKTKDFTVSIDALPVAGQTTVTKTIAELATANNWENGIKYSSFNLDNVISVSASADGNNGKYYTSGSNYRLYQGDSGTITITAATGYEIVSVKVEYTVSNTGTLTLEGNNVASGATTTVDGQSITFGVGNTGSATNGQVRVTAITVIYKAVQA